MRPHQRLQRQPAVEAVVEAEEAALLLKDVVKRLPEQAAVEPHPKDVEGVGPAAEARLQRLR